MICDSSTGHIAMLFTDVREHFHVQAISLLNDVSDQSEVHTNILRDKE